MTAYLIKKSEDGKFAFSVHPNFHSFITDEVEVYEPEKKIKARMILLDDRGDAIGMEWMDNIAGLTSEFPREWPSNGK